MSGPIRLAVTLPARRRCGVRDYALHLAKELPPEFEVSWVTLPEDSCSSAWRVAASAADPADIVHVHYEYGLFRTVKPWRNRFGTFMRRLRRPTVLTLHDDLPALRPRLANGRAYGASDALRDLAYLPFFAGWEERQYRRALHTWVHTGDLEEAVAGKIGPERVTRIFHPIPDTGRRWTTTNGRELRLFTPGFVKPHKGYEELLPALEGRRWRWVIAGGPQGAEDEAYVSALRRTIARRGMSERVEITGYLPREAMESMAREATLAVFPNRCASGSGVLAWAIGLGMPVAATDVPGARALADAGAGIELLQTGETGDWGDRIARLVGNGERLRELSSRNLRFARNHDFRHAAEHFAGVCTDLLAGRNGGGRA